LLLALRIRCGARPSADAVREAVLASAASNVYARRGEKFTAKRLNLRVAMSMLSGASVSTGKETRIACQTAGVEKLSDSLQERPETPVNGPTSTRTGDEQTAKCGCGCSGGSPQLVYSLGRVGFDFGTEARRDSFAQLMGENANSNDPPQLLKYLEDHPWDAESVIWTLNLDSSPVYAIRPVGPFASIAYERIRGFLRQQLSEAVERVSIPGVVKGAATLWSGQTVPVISPEIRGMCSWSTSALVAAVEGQEKGAIAANQLTNFLQRVYFECRNLGIRPQDRALNFAATNALNVASIFESALSDGMELDSFGLEKSPICRPESECWDVKLIFFDPKKQLETARRIYRTTVDVSEVIPVVIDSIRSWSIR
jgi:cyanobactin maturation PatA/PatG family protease